MGDSQPAPISSTDLLAAKQRYWHGLFTTGPLRDGTRITLTGAHLPIDVEARLVSSARTSFDWVRFNTELRDISRRGDRSFAWCLFNEKVLFHGPVNSEGVRATIHFTWCEFLKPVDISELSGLALLDINGSAARGGIQVHNSALETVDINYCKLKNMNIYESSVEGGISIGGCALENLEWMNCNFEQNVLFVEIEVEKALALIACDFKKRVTFSTVTWPKSPYMAANSSGSKFDGIVEIEGGDPPPVQLFQEAEFRSKVSLNWFSDKQKRESFRSELTAAASRSETLFDRQKHAQDVESGCRTLRKVAEVAGDVQSEHLWHRAELIARRARGDSAATEKGFSYLYGWIADYGLSISRPFVVLAINIAAFALLYAWLGGKTWTGSIDWQGIEEGFGYSLNRTIPLGVFADENNVWRQHLLGSAGQASHIGMRALATSQSIISAILIYLGVMAIRRKFRIS